MGNSYFFQERFMYYLRLSDDTSMRSLSPYLGLVETLKVVSAMNPAVDGIDGVFHYSVPILSDYSDLAVLAQLPQLLAERLETESDERVSHLFALFCQCLASVWIGVPGHIGRVLLKHGVDECTIWRGVASFYKGEEPISSYTRRLGLMQLVLDNGADPNTPFTANNESTSQGDWTRILHLVVNSIDAKGAIELLLQKGADPNALDGAGKLPLELVTQRYLRSFDYFASTSATSGRMRTRAREQMKYIRPEKTPGGAYALYLSVAQKLLGVGGRFSDAFRASCTWEITPEAQQTIRSLRIPIDARLPYPPSMARQK
jgi:hypothetical protein